MNDFEQEPEFREFATDLLQFSRRSADPGSI